LPEAILPEMDDVLVRAWQQGKRVDGLTARDASEAAAGPLLAWAERLPGGICEGALPVYFFRVDPIWAASEVSRLRALRPASCFINMGPTEDLISPGLERQAIEDLENPNPLIRREALTALQKGGSPAAEKALLDAFVRRQDQRFDDGFIEGLLEGARWLPSTETADRTRAACLTDNCRNRVDSSLQALQPPIKVGLDYNLNGYAIVGRIFLRSPKQFEMKIAQFPRGTVFHLGTPGSANAFQKKRIDEARKIIEDAGMKLDADEKR
jgi:hypothetical protein